MCGNPAGSSDVVAASADIGAKLIGIGVEGTSGSTTSPVAQMGALANLTGSTADIDGNGTVDIDDLLLALGNFNGTGQGDVDGNGVVDINDILLIVGAWNTSC